MDGRFDSYLQRIEEEIHTALPLHSSEAWSALSFGPQPSCLTAEHVQSLIEPTRSLVDLGGKRWRPLLLVLCAEAQAYKTAKNGSDEAVAAARNTAYHLAPLIEFVHTASLIHDDIEDGSDTRRNQPAVHIRYGMDTAINAASWLYFEAASVIDGLGVADSIRIQLYRLYGMELRKLHLGQALDITWHRDAVFFPSTDLYLTMVKNKTGTLASFAAQAGLLAAGADATNREKAGAIAAHAGAGFQIIDDVINLSSGNPGKKRGDDIVEGKKSLPVLLFAEAEGKDSARLKELHACFQQARNEGIDSPAVERAINLLAKSGAIATARERGIALIKNSCDSFEALFGTDNPATQNIKSLFMAMIPAIL